MYFDFMFFLTLSVFITGFISFIDFIFLSKKRKKNKLPWYIDYSKSFFPVLLLVFIIRAFIVQPYRVPTGSLEPTILPGDFIIVNQFKYGLRFPIFNKKILKIDEPKTGDIVLFRWPKNPNLIFVKRIVGIPGDHIIYNEEKQLIINNKKIKYESC